MTPSEGFLIVYAAAGRSSKARQKTSAQCNARTSPVQGKEATICRTGNAGWSNTSPQRHHACGRTDLRRWRWEGPQQEPSSYEFLFVGRNALEPVYRYGSAHLI